MPGGVAGGGVARPALEAELDGIMWDAPHLGRGATTSFSSAAVGLLAGGREGGSISDVPRGLGEIVLIS